MTTTKIPRDEREKPTDPTEAMDLDDYCRRLRDALDFARKAHPIIRAGSSVPGDAAAPAVAEDADVVFVHRVHACQQRDRSVQIGNRPVVAAGLPFDRPIFVFVPPVNEERNGADITRRRVALAYIDCKGACSRPAWATGRCWAMTRPGCGPAPSGSNTRVCMVLPWTSRVSGWYTRSLLRWLDAGAAATLKP